MEVRDFKNIIFDLGGVIINLDEDRTVKEFAKLSHLSESDIKQYILHFGAYHQFERGLISGDQFRDELRKEFKIESSDEEIDRCMNEMLLDIPVERINLLKSLKGLQLFLLSNTNQIHLKRFYQIFKETTTDDHFDAYFHKAYYSHLVNMRKPDTEIFELVIKENRLDPKETLFLDDNVNNLKGAQSVGIQTFHVENPSQLFQLFK